jgi:CRISPR-associated protein Cas2
MTVLIVTGVRPSLRGELTRWMIEPQAGVFVGRLSARVRDALWKKVLDELGDGSAVMLHPAAREQRFAVRSAGDRDRVPVDFEGVTLIRRKVQRRP